VDRDIGLEMVVLHKRHVTLHRFTLTILSLFICSQNQDFELILESFDFSELWNKIFRNKIFRNFGL